MNPVRSTTSCAEAFLQVSGVLTMEPPVGIEPTTYSLRAAASARWVHWCAPITLENC
jgi:hypothetical protein